MIAIKPKFLLYDELMSLCFLSIFGFQDAVGDKLVVRFNRALRTGTYNDTSLRHITKLRTNKRKVQPPFGR